MTDMNVEEFKTKIQKIIIWGFGFNKRPLNLNNSCIKSSQFCKLLRPKKIIKSFWWKKYWDDVNWLSTL
jgi:hypothetical protein